MAIKNFIKDGSYSRISQINWSQGLIHDVSVDTYASKPSQSYVYVEEYDAYVDDDTTEKKERVMGSETSDDPPMASTVIPIMDAQRGEDNVDTYKEYFLQEQWAADGSDLHTQVYKYLLSLPMFEDAESDE